MRYALLVALVAISVSVLAASPYEATEHILSGSVSGTNTVIVTNATPITGQMLSLVTKSVGGSATVTVYTVAGVGSTLGTTAKTLLAATVVPPGGYVTNYFGGGAQHSLYGDKVVIRTDNAAITAAVSTTTMIITGR